MTLRERLDTIREASKARIPPEARAVMERSVDDLRSSGIMTRIAAVGQKAPDFALPDAAAAQSASPSCGPAGPSCCRSIGAAGDRTATQSWRLCGRPARDHRGRRLAGRDLAQMARTPRETEEPKPMEFALLRDFGNRVAEAYGLAFTLPDDLRAIYLKFASTWRAATATAPGGCRCRPAS